MKKNNWFIGILKKLDILLSIIYDNGSYLTTEEPHRSMVYEPIYLKSKSSIIHDKNVGKGII